MTKPSSSSQGPTSAHLQQQDAKIQALEQAVQAIQADVKQTINQQENKFTAIEAKFHEQQHHTTQLFNTMRQDFQQTLHTAMSQQDTKIATTMDELKKLFIRSTKRRAASSPHDGESDMDS